MQVIGKALLGGTLLCCCMSAAASAQDKTPASAYEFIRSTMADGSWKGETKFCNDDGCTVGERAIITSVYFQDGTYCKIRFYMRDSKGKTLSRDVDLRKNFTIQDYYDELIFRGAVVDTAGESDQSWTAYAPSSDIVQRVKGAVDYLKGACAPASPW